MKSLFAMALIICASASTANAVVVITTERDAAIDGSGVEETSGFFVFDDVPTNVSNDLLQRPGTAITVSRPTFGPNLDRDLEGGSVLNLKNGTAQTSGAAPNQSAFLRDQSIGSEAIEARFHFDLLEVFPIAQFNTYSWHDLGGVNSG